MKAIVQDEYGSADMLRFEDVDVPIAGMDSDTAQSMLAWPHSGRSRRRTCRRERRCW